MSGKFLSQREMGMAKRSVDIANSSISRNKRNTYPSNIVCGCCFGLEIEHVPAPTKEEKEARSYGSDRQADLNNWFSKK